METKYLNEILKKKNISQYRLAQLSGLDRGHISKIVRGGAKHPTIDTMIMIADALDVSLDELVGRNFEERK